MKRMDEVFYLPVQGVDIQGFDVYHSQCDGGRSVDDMIAHAINHVDNLADALDTLLKELDSTYIGSANLSDRIHDADAALAAYRGDK